MGKFWGEEVNLKIMYWHFAIINNRLAEIYFDKDKKGNPEFEGHCYVNREEFRTKAERKAIDEDIAEYRFSYRKGKHRMRAEKK